MIFGQSANAKFSCKVAIIFWSLYPLLDLNSDLKPVKSPISFGNYLCLFPSDD